MGLKMPGDEEILTSKIFLNRANVRSKAKSWLKASTEEGTKEVTSTPGSKSEKGTVDDDLTSIVVSDELSGIGVPSKAGNDDPSNRQLMSANEVLRRKLLSKDAYKRYSEGRTNGAEASRPKAKKVEVEDELREEKGKSSRKGESGPQVPDAGTIVETKADTAAPAKPASKNKKRPSSYLDELLAGRQSKQQKKAKRKADDD